MKKDPKPPRKRGPKPEVLAIEGDWEQAVKKAVVKSPPAKKQSRKNGRAR